MAQSRNTRCSGEFHCPIDSGTATRRALTINGSIKSSVSQEQSWTDGCGPIKSSVPQEQNWTDGHCIAQSAPINRSSWFGKPQVPQEQNQLAACCPRHSVPQEQNQPVVSHVPSHSAPDNRSSCSTTTFEHPAVSEQSWASIRLAWYLASQRYGRYLLAEHTLGQEPSRCPPCCTHPERSRQEAPCHEHGLQDKQDKCNPN